MKLSAQLQSTFSHKFPPWRHRQSCYRPKLRKRVFCSKGQMEMSNSRSNSNILFFEFFQDNFIPIPKTKLHFINNKLSKQNQKCIPKADGRYFQMRLKINHPTRGNKLLTLLPITTPSRHQETSELGHPPIMSHLFGQLCYLFKGSPHKKSWNLRLGIKGRGQGRPKKSIYFFLDMWNSIFYLESWCSLFFWFETYVRTSVEPTL